MSDANFHTQVRALYHNVAELAGDERRRALATTDAPQEVVDEVRSLLDWSEPDGGTLLLGEDRLGAAGARILDASSHVVARASIGRQIGPYRLERILGSGGMGTVYLAEQRSPVRRRVALKLIKAGMDTGQVVARFEAERQALARMEHPFIARVIDGGATDDGLPFFVMELVDGLPITEHCDVDGLRIAARLQLFVQVCQAVQHAHQKGVIHRDLKPSNVLVARSESGPVPKVIDFGVAKATDGSLTDLTLVTAVQQIVGTLEYMAPERLDGSGADADTRVDVYALGVLLYELLTGVLPFDVDGSSWRGFDGLVRTIRTVEPLRPSVRFATTCERSAAVAERRGLDPARLRATLRGDLDWIVVRALEKDPERRYESAAALAQDVERYLCDEPIVARPPSRAYRLRKLVRRHRGFFAAAAAVLVTLAVGVVAATTGWSEAERANLEVRRQLARASAVRDVLVTMLGSVDPRVALGADTTLMRSVLDDTARRLFDATFGDEVVRGDLHLVAGRVYVALGAQEEAARHFEALRALRDPELLPLQLEAGVELTRIHRLAGRLAAAQALVRELRPAAEREAGPDSLVALDLRQEEVLLRASSDPIGAVERQVELLDAARAALGEEHPWVTDAMVELGSLQRDAGRSADAARVLQAALERSERRSGRDAPETLAVRAELVFVLFDQSRYAEAEHDAWLVHEGRRAILGDDHPATLTALGSLAVVWAATGRLDEARPALERVLAQPADVFPEDDPNREVFTDVLAGVYAHQGDDAAAIKLLEPTLARIEQRSGTGTPRGFPTRNNLVSLYARNGRIEEAQALGRESLELERASLGADHEMTLALAINIADSHLQAGEPEEALRILDDVVPRQLRAFGPNHRFSAYALALLAAGEQAVGRDGHGLEFERTALADVLARAEAGDATAAELREAARQLLEHPEPSLRDAARALALLRRIGDPRTSEDPAFLAMCAAAFAGVGDAAGQQGALRRGLKYVDEGSPLGERLAAELVEDPRSGSGR